jgi:hypothetical protein
MERRGSGRAHPLLFVGSKKYETKANIIHATKPTYMVYVCYFMFKWRLLKLQAIPSLVVKLFTCVFFIGDDFGIRCCFYL